ncbi:MAG: response regulator [Elusimicrobiota bacterium]
MARILIIDDDTELVQILTMALQSCRHQVASAGDPVAGFEVCRKFHPDIILLDYHMPGDTGAHLFETFRRNQATSRTPILFMSAMASPEQILGEVADPAVSRFIPKPIKLAELKRNIGEMLGPGGDEA